MRFLRLETAVFLCIWLGLMMVGGALHFGDPGSLWHIVVGQRILSSGELPHSDSFSFTYGGQPWIASWWLAECAMAILHRLGGLDTVLLAATTLLAILYTWIALRLKRAGIHPLLVLLILAMTLAASSYHFHPRPHIVTIALMGWTMARLSDFESGRASLTKLFWLVPVFILWTNIHGGMVGGIGTVVLAVVGWGVTALIYRLPSFRGRLGHWFIFPDAESCEGAPPRLTGRQFLLLCVLAGACALTPLVNPYGLEMPRVWFSLILSPVVPKVIGEHFPLRDSPAEAATVLFFGAVYLAAFLGTLPRWPRITWVIPLIWLVLAWKSVRHGPIFAITTAVALADMFPHVRWIAWLARNGSVTCRIRMPEEPRHDWRTALIPLAVVLTAFGLQIAGIRFPILGHGWTKLDPKACPVELLPQLREIERNGPHGAPIFNDMLYGGFLIYFTPNLYVFIDDRCELYGDEGLLRYADAVLEHPERIDEWAKQYGFEHALVQADSSFDKYLATNPRWTEADRTATAVLYRQK